MRKREKLTPEERFALALALVKRDQSLEEICLLYQVSHTTAYKLRNAFLDGARRALGAPGRGRAAERDGGHAPAVTDADAHGAGVTA
jgi:transposase-like protein